MQRSPLVAALIAIACGTAAAEDRPNILWITAEDFSPALGCYGDSYAHTPNIDGLAAESVRYTHAFATAPVCSPARSCLITGRYAPSLGTQDMRSAFPIPERMEGFPSRLRKLGYYTTNNKKTDYNTSREPAIVEASWDESSGDAHWRKRDGDAPFFSVFNLVTSHQSRAMVWPRRRFLDKVQSRLKPAEIHDPAKAPVPPYYPDTMVVRRTVARFYDCVTAMDKEVGAILDQLEADGLADETIVFFYGDHGTGLPRHKRALLDTGMRVPLLVRFPEKYEHLAPAEPGETVDRLVSFVDFGPTVLSLAGADIPDDTQGKPFLGEAAASPREYVYGHRDRVDEAFDVARSVRSKRYLYIRNYRPDLGYNQPSWWPDKGVIRDEIYRLAAPKTMTDPQWHYAAPSRPVEELYDCREDPKNLHNLADSDEHQDVLRRLRKANRRHLREIHDVGFLPESEAWKVAENTTPWKATRDGSLDVGPLIDAASDVGKAKEATLLSNLASERPGVRYWGAIGLAARDSLSAKARKALEQALSDGSAAVRTAAARALGTHGEADKALPVLTDTLKHDSLTAVLKAARNIEMLGDAARGAVPAMRQVLERARSIRPSDTPATVVQTGKQDLAMFTSFAAKGFLARRRRGEWARLFDGETLDVWEARADGKVEAKNGEIRMLSKGANLWLAHEKAYKDFELRVEAKMPDHYNSGIGFRCQGEEGKPKGYQCELDGKRSGKVYAIGSGWVWPTNEKEKQTFRKRSKGVFRKGGWNTFRIRCRGNRIEIWLNGVKTTDIRDDRFKKGFVSLQHHGSGGVHRFRNIWIRPLRKLPEDGS